MLLDEWLETHNVSLKRFERALINPHTKEPYSYTTLFRYAHLAPCDSYMTAKVISEATHGEVTIPELADPDIIAAAVKARGARTKKPPPDKPSRRKRKITRELPLHTQPLSPAPAPARKAVKRKRAATATLGDAAA